MGGEEGEKESTGNSAGDGEEGEKESAGDGEGEVERKNKEKLKSLSEKKKKF